MARANIGKYNVVRELGRGGMASVYLAHDPDLDSHVAIKVIAAHFLGDAAFRERFLREARIIARLRHDAIVPVHYLGEDEEGAPYLVMERMDGGSLEDRLDGRPLLPSQAVAILRRVAAALDAAHNAGVIHRDVKPGNVLFDSEDRAYMTDFGIAHLSESGATATAVSMIGTPSYMSPEQASGSPIVPSSDTYSLGAMAYEMLTGRTPFAENTSLPVLLHKHVYETPPVPSSVNQALNSDVDDVVMRAMAKEPGARFPAASAFAAALADAVRHGSGPRPASNAGTASAVQRPAAAVRPGSPASGATLSAQLELLRTSRRFGIGPAQSTYRMTIHNTGDAPTVARLTAGAGSDAISVAAPATVAVNPGESAFATIQVTQKPGGSGRKGGALPFTVAAADAAGVVPPAVASGVYTDPGGRRLSVLLAGGIGLACIGGIAAAVMVLAGGGGDDDAAVPAATSERTRTAASPAAGASQGASPSTSPTGRPSASPSASASASAAATGTTQQATTAAAATPTPPATATPTPTPGARPTNTPTPVPPTATPTQAAEIPAPTLLGPADGAVFDNFPRTTTLSWRVVPGAEAYNVYIEQGGCASLPCDDWSPSIEDTVKSTSYTFDFVGAQAGRWYVAAIVNGELGPRSSPREFLYTR